MGDTVGYRKISFLDVRVLVEDDLLHADVYSKPTDAHQYLNYKSCHPLHVKRGILYGQAVRFKRICDSNDVFERRLVDLRGLLSIEDMRRNDSKRGCIW